MGPTPDDARAAAAAASRGAALRTLFGATTAVCRGEMDAAAWLVDDATGSGLAEPVLSISPIVTRRLLQEVRSAAMEDDPGLLTCELGLACRGRFPEGSGSIGSLCLLAAVGRIDPWDPSCVLAMGFRDAVPVWGAIASTWFATERIAGEHRQDPASVAERICLQIAASLAGPDGQVTRHAA